MNDDYNTVVTWIAERAPTEVYTALVRLRLGGRCQGCEDAPLGQHTGPHDWEAVPPVQKRMGEVIRQDGEDIAALRAEVERLRETVETWKKNYDTVVEQAAEQLRVAVEYAAELPQSRERLAAYLREALAKEDV
jgi:hypothetical protein